MFRIDMLPAAQGDCLWIEYGDPSDPHRILIDGGPATHASYGVLRSRVAALPRERRRFELIVVSHIDIDHIDGVVRLLEDDLGVTYDDFWFNGFQHLMPGVETFGGRSGERLTARLRNGPWNQSFCGRAVATDGGRPVSRTLPGGMELTVLSPGTEELRQLHPKWEAEARAAGLSPGLAPPEHEKAPGIEVFGPPNVEQLLREPYESDDTLANGSSIALYAEYENTSAALLADAFAEVLLPSIDHLVGAGNPLETDLVKVSHHGSRGNTPAELVKRLHSPRWLISASGAYYRHPNREAIARIVKHAPDEAELVFNYETEFTRPWNTKGLKQRYRYQARFPSAPEEIMEVRLA